MTAFGGLSRVMPVQGLVTLSDQLVVHQSHHHALFLDQTVVDALGGEGWAVKKQAAFEASHAVLSSLCGELGIRGAEEKLDLAAELFAALGHGKLAFELGAEGGQVRGQSLFLGTSFSEKYGGLIRNRKSMDAFAAGFASAAASLAYPSDWGLFDAEETACVARRDPACVFSLSRRPERARFGTVVTRTAVETMAVPAGDADDTTEAGRTASGVSKILGALSADDHGRVRVFGVNLALVPASYTGQITYDTMHLVEKRTPELFPVFAALVREAAQIGTFHLLGGVLASSKWIADFGLPARDVELRMQQLVGIARALGWGHLEVSSFVPGRSLVLAAPMTQESVYYAVRHGTTVRSRLAFLQGAALGLMQLCHRVDFGSERPIQRETYDALFKEGTRFHVEETRSTLRGDEVCEVVVDALADR